MTLGADGDRFNMSTTINSRGIQYKTQDEAVSEDLVWARTQAVAAPGVDFAKLSEMSLKQWGTGVGRYKSSKDHNLRAFSRQRTSLNISSTTEVLVIGDIPCSVAEVAAWLCCPREEALNMAHGRRESVVHSFIPVTSDTQDGECLTPSRCVKTTSFKHPQLALMDPDERWCFLEELTPFSKDSTASERGFTLSQRSLHPDALPWTVRPPVELVRRRRGLSLTRTEKRRHQLTGLSLGYSVEAITGRPSPAVRMVFYGCASSNESETSVITQRRIKLLARDVLKLPELVCRGRIRVQVPGPGTIETQTAKNATSPVSSQCVGCSRKLYKFLGIKKTRCYLCAQFVCWRCWARQPLDTANGRQISVLMCPHCWDSIQNCPHAHLATSRAAGRRSSASTSSHGSGGDGENPLK